MDPTVFHPAATPNRLKLPRGRSPRFRGFRCVPRAGRRVRGACGAFTLVELLVVISVVALLISMLLPALKQARTAARLVDCSSRMRQQAVVFTVYANDHKDALPVTSSESRSVPAKVVQHELLINEYSDGDGGIWYCPEYQYRAFAPGAPLVRPGDPLLSETDAAWRGGGFYYGFGSNRAVTSGGCSGPLVHQRLFINQYTLADDAVTTGQWAGIVSDYCGSFPSGNLDAARRTSLSRAEPGTLLGGEGYPNAATSTAYSGAGTGDAGRSFGIVRHTAGSDTPIGGNLMFVDGSVSWSTNLLLRTGLKREAWVTLPE